MTMLTIDLLTGHRPLQNIQIQIVKLIIDQTKIEVRQMKT